MSKQKSVDSGIIDSFLIDDNLTVESMKIYCQIPYYT